ncbi:hypothetical protein BKA69DRAFT_785128 [Paraphysoderma sedebokerense]|nr:hypothetical protein BKA69DRAFT_785128 [Paraphysoderma sedebokerense]
MVLWHLPWVDNRHWSSQCDGPKAFTNETQQNMSGNFVPVFNVLLPLFNCIGAVCHYTMLVERAVPFLRHNPFASSPKKNTVFKIVLANLLGLPAWIQVFVHPIQPNGPVDMAAILANMIINIIAKVVLTAIFLQVLLENREKNTLWSIISNNKRQWFQLLFCVFTWF